MIRTTYRIQPAESILLCMSLGFSVSLSFYFEEGVRYVITDKTVRGGEPVKSASVNLLFLLLPSGSR